MKVSLVSFTHSILLCLACWGSNFSIASQDALVKWLRTKPNGFFSDKIEWKPLDPEDPKSSVAMFAAVDIPKDETLIVVPQSALITSKNSTLNCDTVKYLLEELEKGKESDFFPYVDYLFGEDSKRGILPVSWSQDAKDMLDAVIGDSLHPEGYKHQKAANYCRKEFGTKTTQLQEDAYQHMISRSWNDKMIPVYDMINHRNGKWRNVENTSPHDGEDVKVFAYRDIVAGEQLYMSYTECNDQDCHPSMKYKYLSSQLLVDYGFVEQYPRRFYLEEEKELVAEVDIDESTGQKILSWPLGQLPDFDQVNYMVGQLKRLNKLNDDLAEGLPKLNSGHERSVIAEYHRAYKEVLQLAVAYRNGERRPPSSKAKKYDPLIEPKGLGAQGRNVEVCWSNPSDQNVDSVDISESQYQEIEFTYNEGKDNTCLRLSGWLQTCTNFRPHYHEAFVHIPAQYVDDVKRVAFLGGGDNMILHEILKYPNLELVVGMELDQQVIRSAYKNLGTLPYFDDHRVHWWFGDATKSLFALPESYFGSFDLVLVDLQTFVADALKVTDKLTIMDTAILLMKQDGGVIAKNEDFSVRTNVGFAKYTVDLEYHNLPQICQQSITMGSNSIDFVTAATKFHNIETLAIDLPESEDVDLFDSWYSYRQTVRDTCAATYEKNDSCTKDPVGILVILEAENVTTPLESKTNVKKAISESIKGSGLNDVSVSSGNDEATYVFVMKEGYVTARLFAENKLISFDVLLWDSLDLIENVIEGLMKSVGGNLEESSTSFRFVSGGMSGIGSCQKDVLTEVAARTEALLCEDDANDITLTSSNSGYDKAILGNLVKAFIPNQRDGASSVIGILCSYEKSDCSSFEAAKELAMEVVPIYSCTAFDEMHLCENELAEKLQGIVMEYKKLDALVMDTDLPFAMGQIIESFFSDPVTHDQIMERNHLVLTPVVEDEGWRNVLIDRFRTDIVLFDGAHRADLRFSTKDTSLKWSLFSAYHEDFYNTLYKSMIDIEESTGLQYEVEEIANGIVTYVADFEPEMEFTDSEYDKTRSTAQWNSQTPVGHQTIFNLSLQPPKMQLKEGERVLAEIDPGPWDAVYGMATVESYLGNEMYSVLYDVDDEPEPITRGQIRKFSKIDEDPSTTFDVGDLVFYKHIEYTGPGEYEMLFENGVVSRADEDGTYSIYMLNPSGSKLYGVTREELVHQFETENFYEEISGLSTPKLLDTFEKSLKSKVVGSGALSPVESFTIGSGVVMTAFWDKGHSILKWDGMQRVDINLFTYEEDKKLRLEFQDAFCDEIEHMNKVSRDEHPRGYGSVVNFPSEIANPPHWVGDEFDEYEEDDDEEDDDE